MSYQILIIKVLVTIAKKKDIHFGHSGLKVVQVRYIYLIFVQNLVTYSHCR